MGWWKKETCHSTSHTPNKQGNTYKKLKYSCVSRPSRSSCYLLQTLYHSSSHYTSRQSISRCLAFYFYQLCKWRWHAMRYTKWKYTKIIKNEQGESQKVIHVLLHDDIAYIIQYVWIWSGRECGWIYQHSFYKQPFILFVLRSSPGTFLSFFWNIHDTKWIEWNGMEQIKRKMRVVKHVTLQKHANSFFKAKDDVMWRDGMQGCFIICHMEYISSFLFPSSSYDHVHFFGRVVI